jgi:uncharacterized protein involved in exopolysaccharide biosynthesis
MMRPALTLLTLLLAATPSVHVRADCTGNSCSDSHHQERVAQPAQAMSRAAREASEYLDVWVTRRVLRLRLGAQHPDVIATDARLLAMHQALSTRTASDDAELLASLRASLAETEARLAELGSRCGPQHLDMRGAELRRDALAALIEARLRGEALPLPTSA